MGEALSRRGDERRRNISFKEKKCWRKVSNQGREEENAPAQTGSSILQIELVAEADYQNEAMTKKR